MFYRKTQVETHSYPSQFDVSAVNNQIKPHTVMAGVSAPALINFVGVIPRR